MKHPVLTFLWLFMLVLLSAGCTELYNPELEERPPVLVVDGLVTNQPGPATVRLNLAKPYDAEGAYTAVTGAIVTIYESPGGIYWLREAEPGYYVTDTGEFRAVPWKTYQLRVETSDHVVYESAPQLLLPPAVPESVSGVLTPKEYITSEPGGTIAGRMEQSVESYLDFRSVAGPEASYRFKTRLLLGSSWVDFSTLPFPTVYYNWKKLRDDPELKLASGSSIPAADSAGRYAVNHFPLSRHYYELRPDEWPDRFFLQVKLYTLNEDALAYYREVEKQVSATGRLFDPIATQVRSNMQCVNRNGITVLGFFEVSSFVKQTYLVRPLTGENRVEYKITYDMDSIPDEGSSPQNTPYFWN